jgi:large subunit ribosomal protein L4
MEAIIYNNKGEKTGTIDLPVGIFGLPWNADLMHQVVVGMQANARGPIAHTKDRGEVRGGGRKPWKQKGTGRARHGSTRSPIWTGGGVAHGPRNDRSYAQKINRKQAQKALLVALSRKAKDGELIFVDSFGLTEPKAAQGKAFLSAFSKNGFTIRRKNAATIAITSHHPATLKSFANFSNVSVEEVRNLNPLSVLSKKYVIIENPSAAIEVLSKKSVVKSV